MEFLGQSTGNDGWYGKGFYFSTVPAYCHHYQVFCCAFNSFLQPGRVTKQAVGSISIMAAWVLLGRPHVMQGVSIVEFSL
jgi:hypothetical protein